MSRMLPLLLILLLLKIDTYHTWQPGTPVFILDIS